MTLVDSYRFVIDLGAIEQGGNVRIFDIQCSKENLNQFIEDRDLFNKTEEDDVMNSDLLKRLTTHGYKMANSRLVQDWWPNPVIKSLPESLWGTKWENVGSNGLLHKYECSSFSAIGFHHEKIQTAEGLPKNKCLAYGETPQQAYDRWCEVFNSWNEKEDWVK